jgi:anti-anti-sigma factor
MTARAMPGVQEEKSARAGCVVTALHGELDVCTAADGLRALTALVAARARIIVDLAELAYIDCYSLRELMAVRAQALRAGGDLVLAGPQPVVLRLLVLCGIVSHRLVFTSVDEAASGAAAFSGGPG